MSTCKAFISGCAGETLTSEERDFFAVERPVGLILFARNCRSKDQVRALVEDYRQAVGAADLFVLIDQEGGRVARLTPPEWLAFPSGRRLGGLIERDGAAGEEAVSLLARYLASELYELGINVDCLPVLDVPVPGADDIIGERAYGVEPDLVVRGGRAAAAGLLQGGVLPVAKHIPGHGRASCDSHLALPVIEEVRETLWGCDFVPFKALNDLPLGMTAHVVLPSYDARNPASTSSVVIDEVIRGEIGFDGALMCDDLSMKALSGSMAERTNGVFAAGCDLALHCNGVMTEMKDVAAGSPELTGKALQRVEKAFSKLQKPEEFDLERAEHLRSSLLSA